MDFELKKLDTEETNEQENPITGDFELRKLDLTPEERRPEYDPTPRYKAPEIEEQLIESGDLETAVAISNGDLPWALGVTRGISEEEFSRVKRVAEATKLPKDTVFRNPKMAEDVLLSQNIVKKLTERDKEGNYLYPMTLAYLSSPERVAEARSEYNNLADIEKIYKEYYQKDEGFFKKSYRSIMTGLASINKNLAQTPALIYDIAALPQNLIADAVGIDEIRAKAPDWARNNPLANYYEKQAELWKPLELDESFADLLKEDRYGDIAENVLYQSMSNIPNLALMAAMNYASGGSAALATMGTISASERAARGAELNENPSQYALASIAYGGAEALFERVTLGALKNFGKQLTKKVGEESAKQVMTRVGKLMLGSAVDEGISEANTTIVQDFADYSVGQKANIPKTSLNALNSFLVGAVTGGTLSGASVMTQNLAKVNKAKIDVKGFNKLVEIAKGSELRTRSKAAFEEFVDTMATQTEAARSFFVNMKEVGALFQESDEDVFEFFERMGKNPDEVKAAQETGSDVELNTAKFLAEYGDTEIAEKIAPDVKFQADGMSEKEANEYQKEVDERVEGMQEEYKQHVKDNTIPPSIMKIRNQLVEEFGINEKEADAKVSLVMAASEVFAREYGVNRDDYIENKLNLELRVRPEGQPQGLFQVKEAVYTEDSKQYPLAPKDEWYGDADFEVRGGRLVNMTPDEFLSQVKPLEIDEASRDNIDDLKRHIQEGRRLDPLAIYENGKEDGRHRALAAKELGIQQVPVLEFRGQPQGLFQTEAVDDELVTVHNLTADKLKNVDKVGGLAVPSLAVNKAGRPLEGFGDITLVASPDIIKSKGAKAFDADVYSPRYPNVELVADRVKIEENYGELLKKVDAKYQEEFRRSFYDLQVRDDIKDQGTKYSYDPTPRLLFAESKGVDIKDRTELSEFINKNEAEYQEFFNEFLDNIVEQERIFKGYTPSGTRKYLPHTLDNVVKLMKKDLRDGENFNYGAGSIRATVAKQFRTIKQIQNDRDRLVSNEVMEKAKEEANNELIKLFNEEFEPSLKYKSNQFMALDDFSEHLKEMAETRDFRSVVDQYYDGVTDEGLKKAADYLVKLKNMPTEYFEVKVQRGVTLDEFQSALVPEETSKDIIKILEKNGINVVEYKDGKRAEALKGLKENQPEVFFQGPKGSIQFFDDKNVINLFEKADMSTFLHETGHLFINEMETAVNAGVASKQMQKDFQALKDFAGEYDSREGKEKLAKAFEMYLREGKAPSTKLLSAFRKFRSWLSKIYRTVKNLDVNVNDDVRQVFDRMLASQDEMNEVQEYYRSKEIEKSVFNEIDLSKTSQEKLQNMREAARSKALEEQVKKALSVYYKTIGGVDKIKEEAINEVENDPVYQSVDYIIDSGGLTNSILNYYLHPDDKKDVLKTHVKREPILDKEGNPVLNIKGNPTFKVKTLLAKSETYELPLADILGDFGVGLSEQEFMSQLVTKPSKTKAIQERTDQLKAYAEEQIREEIESQETIPGEEAYHTEEQYKYLVEEGNELYNYMYRLKTGKKPPKKFYNGKVYKDAAREILLKMPVREAVQYNKYSAVEAKYSKEVYEAIKKNDLEALEEAKEKQLRNHAMVSVAVELNKRLTKIENRLKKTANRKQGSLLGDYQDVIKDVLQKYGVIKQGPKRPDKLNAQAIFNTIEDPDAIDPIVLPDTIKSIKAIDYKGLTYEELIELDTGIAIIASRGRNTVNLGKNFEGVPIEDVVNKTIQPMQGRKRTKPPARYSSMYKFKEGLNAILAETIHVQFDLKAADNYTSLGKDRYDIGPNEAMFDLVKEKHDEVNRTLDNFNKEYMDEISKEFVKINNRLKTGKRGIDIPGVPVPRVLQEAYGQPGWTSEMIVSFVLNMGNEGNLNTLLAGYDLTMEQALKVAGQLEAAELKSIQGAWNAINTLFDSMDDTFYRLNGYRLKKVEAQELSVDSSDGQSVTLEGGYYPIHHDRKLSREIAGYQEKDLLQNDMQSVYHRAKPKDSQTKERVGSKYPVALNVSALYKHINDTVRYTSLAPVLTDVHKVMNNKLYVKTYSQLMGNERYNILTPWLSHIARPQSRYNDVFERITQRYQSLSAIGALGVNLLSLSKQALSLTSSIQKLGLLEVGTGIVKMAQNPIQNIKDIEKKSIFMKDRSSKVEQEIAQQLQKISPFKKGVMIGDKKLTVKDLQDFALINIRIGDIMGAYPTWMAGYHKALNRGDTEQQAIKFADKVVSETQPVLSTMFKNLWQMGGSNSTGAGKLLRWVTSPFTGWTMKFGSRSRTYWRGWKEGSIPTKEFARHVFYERLLPPMLASILIGTLRDEKLDDPELYIYELLSYQLSWMPGINQIPGAIKYFGFGGTMELPQGKTITNTAKVMKKAFNKDVAGFAQALAEFAEFETGLPAYKTYKEIKRTAKALSGEE